MVCLNLNNVLIACVFSIIPFILPVDSRKRLGLCKLSAAEFNPNSFAIKGMKGDMGDVGDRGSNGIKGKTGDSLKGSPGDIGDKGLEGPGGIQGGPGLIGLQGMQGNKGQMGVPGSMGLPGLTGEDGVCPCAESRDIKTAVAEGIEITLHGKVCKNVGSIGTKNVVQVTFDDIAKVKPVLCKIRKGLTTLTCIPSKKSSEHTFTNISKGFWLSSKEETLDKIYNVDHDFIQWFLKKSNSVFQKIRYHCFNSVPYSSTKVDKALLLLGWNEKIIGPEPTLKNPFFYHVPDETDFCSKTKNEWTYTDIILVSENNQRLPIMDFYIRDTNNEVEQKFYIEHLELCFD